MRIDRLTEAARAESPCWDEARARRLLTSTLARGERRVARARLLRRSLGVASAASVIVLVLLRGAPSSAGASSAADRPVDDSALLAAHAGPLGDGGYGRD